jgi:hypothetical protein
LLFLPLAVVGIAVQEVLTRYTAFGTFLDGVESDPIVAGATALLFGQLSTILASIAVAGAVAHALRRIHDGERPDAVEAYKGSWPGSARSAWPGFA